MIVSIASGKGGTGKTLVATSLALALKVTMPVTLLDCDVEEPNDHIYIRARLLRTEPVNTPVPLVDESKCTSCGMCQDVCAFNAIAVLGSSVLVFNELCHGCGACTRFCPAGAITEAPHQIGVVEVGDADGIRFIDGILTIGQPMAPPIIRQVKKHTGTEGVTIIDASPGTSCPVVEAVKGSDYCILVTEPTPFGLNDLRLAVETVRELHIRHGVVINRAGVGDAHTEEYCSNEGIPVLMTIPLDERIARSYSRGVPLIEALPEYQARFLALYGRIEELVA
ncbi:MAG: ATP-binding protein [Dehalococcoidia bacterium]|jgi:MinD superfamily P-loop ATPase|nr:ATP-binding protein [Dehalococcoidia bacterium]